MGVDCDIYLPGNVRVRDVADVIAALAGKPTRLETIRHRGKGISRARVDGVTVDAEAPALAGINVAAPLSEAAMRARKDAQQGCYCYFCFECSGKFVGWRGLHPPSTAFWIAIGKALVDFFGGKLDYSDRDDKIDYSRPAKTNSQNCPSDGRAWDTFQRRIAAIQPLTEEDFRAAEKRAGIKVQE